MRAAFVRKTLNQLIQKGLLSTDHSILAVCAGSPEAELFNELGFKDVIISNIAETMSEQHVKPFQHKKADLQDLPFESQSFDFVFVSDGLHHCASPHAGLVEMIRAARIGVIVFEARDSFFMRLAFKLNLVNPYECEAVLQQKDLSAGGLNNGPIPNYVYRWTEREFQKTVQSAEPYGPYRYKFFYGLNVTPPNQNKLTSFAIRFGVPFVRLVSLFFPKQKNSFAMVAIKPKVPEELWPWLESHDGELVFNQEYAKAHR